MWCNKVEMKDIEEPLNREPPVEDLVSNFITEEGPYDRNHGPIPNIDPSKHVVNVARDVAQPLSHSIYDLATSFPQHEVTCVL
jgi:sulfite oxidase